MEDVLKELPIKSCGRQRLLGHNSCTTIPVLLKVGEGGAQAAVCGLVMKINLLNFVGILISLDTVLSLYLGE